MEPNTATAKTKKYSYDYEQYEDGGKSVRTMVDDILSDPAFPSLEGIIIGDWGNTWDDGCQDILDGIVAHAEEFSHITSLFIGDMDSEECEVSWIMQGDYSKLWAAMPQLKELTIKGSTDLSLGQICHEGLESLTIICGGLPADVIHEIQEAKLPNLKKLLLYIGVEDYGFDGDAATITSLLAQSDFPKLEYLGITDSEIQDELTEAVLDSKYMGRLHTLDLSNGTLSDKGGQALLEKLPAYPNIRKLDLHYNYLSQEMAGKLGQMGMDVDVSERNQPSTYNGRFYMDAMLTE